jgi:ankyrin repeat protein
MVSGMMILCACASQEGGCGAVRQGEIEETARLLDGGADAGATVPASVKAGEFGTAHFDNDGDTLLIAALRSTMNAGTRPGLVRLLLQHGARVNAADKAGRTPLMWAAFAGDIRVLAILLDNKASVNRTDGNLRTCLHHAVMAPVSGKVMESICLMLLDAGADPLARDSNRQTPLDVLVERAAGHPPYRNQAVEDLLGRAKDRARSSQE